MRQHAAERETLTTIWRQRTRNWNGLPTGVHDLKSPLITIGLRRPAKKTLPRARRPGEGGPGEDRRGRRADGAAGERILERRGLEDRSTRAEVVALNSLAAEAIESLRGEHHEVGGGSTCQQGLPVVLATGGAWRGIPESVENAVKYRGDQPRPRIVIGGEERGGEVHCYVRDNGLGVEPVYHERIFRSSPVRPFVRRQWRRLALVNPLPADRRRPCGKVWGRVRGRGRGATSGSVKSPPRPG